MHEHWTKTTLGDVATWYSGATPKAGSPEYYQGGTIHWATIGDIQDCPISGTASKITEAGAEVIGRLAPPGAVLVSMYGTIGRTGLSLVPMATNQAIAWGVADLTRCSGEFLFVLMQSMRRRLDALGRGATQRNINREILREQKFLLPPLPVQRRIVDLIGALDAQIEALSAEVLSVEAVLDRQRDALPPAQELPLGRVLTAIDSGRSVLTAGEDPVEGRPRILKISAVRPGLFSPDESKWLDTEIVMPEGSRVRDGDLLITRSNTPDRVGFCARARNVPSDTFMPDLIWRLRLDESLVDPDYLEQSLSSPMMRSRLTTTATGSSASMRKINKQGVSAIQVPIPTMEAQFKYAQTCLSISSVGLALCNERAALSLVRSTLLGSLLSGTVEVSESYDALLEAG